MKPSVLVDIKEIANGTTAGYGNRLDAYSFYSVDAMTWLASFRSLVEGAIGTRYFPVYRMADGEMHFLFGPVVNLRRQPLRSILRWCKYGLFAAPLKTIWGETYRRSERQRLRRELWEHLRQIVGAGAVALYWNENGLDAFNEFNSVIYRRFSSNNILLNGAKYFPFHFPAALLAQFGGEIVAGRSILIISSLTEDARNCLRGRLAVIGATRVEFRQCSGTRALVEDVEGLADIESPDIILVAAGIGAARVLVKCAKFKCPVIDIGSYIHVLSGEAESCHSGFFRAPAKLQALP